MKAPDVSVPDGCYVCCLGSSHGLQFSDSCRLVMQGLKSLLWGGQPTQHSAGSLVGVHKLLHVLHPHIEHWQEVAQITQLL